MEKTSHPGNSGAAQTGKNGGFIMLDALLCVFIAGLFLASMYESLSLQSQVSAGLSNSAAEIIQERNNLEWERMEDPDDEEK